MSHRYSTACYCGECMSARRLMQDAQDRPQPAAMCRCGHLAAAHAASGCLVMPEGKSWCACKAFDATPLKPTLSLLPWGAFPEVAEVMQSGVPKHGAHGWREPGKHTTAEYLDKALRHLAAHLGGVKLDAESGKKHLAHAAADLLIALELDQ